MSDGILWTAQETVAATGGRSVGPDWDASGVAIDSRSVQPGDLFVALRGPNHDAHRFVVDALANGAAAAIVAAVPEGLPKDAALIVVADTLHAMEALGRAARQRVTARIVAITGSVGKTGTKSALAQVLSRLGRTHASVGSYNNHWGVPLSLARMPRDTEFGIFEIGMNHPGEIRPLVAQVRPHIALVTNVEAVHLAYFQSVDAIADAKAEIFSGVLPGGTAVLGRDGAYFDRLCAHALDDGIEQIHSFGQHADSLTRLTRDVLHPTCSCVTALVAGTELAYKIGAPGRHWVTNSLAVLATVQALDGDLAIAGLALADVQAPPGRGQRHHLGWGAGAIEVIDESYNASPVAMRAAFDLLAAARPGPRGRRVAVLGDMRELGDQADGFHRALAGELVDRNIDLAFCAGPHMAALFEALPPVLQGHYAADSEALLAPVAAALRAGDVVLVKGSLGSRLGPVVAGLLALRENNGDHPDMTGAGGGG